MHTRSKLPPLCLLVLLAGLTTLTVHADGSTETTSESYRVVEDALIVTGEDYMINAKYSIENKQMIVVSPKTRIVLEEVEESA